MCLLVLVTTAGCSPVDLYVVIDQSSSMGTHGFRMAVQLVHDLIKNLPVSQSEYNIAVATVSTQVKVIYPLSYTDGNDLAEQVINVQHSEVSITVRNVALDAVRILQQNRRTGAKQIVMFVGDAPLLNPHQTTNCSRDEMQTALSNLKVVVVSKLANTECN